MHLAGTLISHDDIINFGHRIAKAISSISRDRPWIIAIGADADSGKSLIALAIDQVLSPHHYPFGIARDISADTHLAGGNPESTRTVFYNYGRLINRDKPSFDSTLEKFEKENPGAKALIAANIERTYVGDFDYASQGLQSDRLHLAIQVYKHPGQFQRRVGLTVEDSDLVLKLATVFEPRLKHDNELNEFAAIRPDKKMLLNSHFSSTALLSKNI